ncbi:MAG: PilT/PilU family type 4a pilus ATPase [Armatimonadota bacterium]
MIDILELAKLCMERGASDIYLKVGSPPMLRIEGTTVPVGDEPLKPEDTSAVAEQLMRSDRDRELFREKHQVNLAWSVYGLGRFRVNVYTQRGTTALVLRRVALKVPSIEEMNLPPILCDLVMQKNGLILVTGATGTGKSTTLAAMVNYRNENSAGHIVTMEDPIEFLHSDKKSIVSQREIGTDVESFEDAMRDAVRQAPDVILLGELRDLRAIETALHMCETGHLVLGTMHSTNATQTMERLLNFYGPDEQAHILMLLSLNLRGVISQRLVPRADGNGRVAALEILIATPRIREIIRRGELPALKDAMAAGTQEGMQTFDQALYNLCKQGLITEDVAVAFAESPGDLRLRMRGITIGT